MTSSFGSIEGNAGPSSSAFHSHAPHVSIANSYSLTTTESAASLPASVGAASLQSGLSANTVIPGDRDKGGSSSTAAGGAAGSGYAAAGAGGASQVLIASVVQRLLNRVSGWTVMSGLGYREADAALAKDVGPVGLPHVEHPLLKA